jgi:hypothetical protein
MCGAFVGTNRLNQLLSARKSIRSNGSVKAAGRVVDISSAYVRISKKQHWLSSRGGFKDVLALRI